METLALSSINGHEPPVVVVGTGPVGMHFARRLAELAPSQPLLLFGSEPALPYDRIRLSDLLAGRASPQSVYLPVPVGSPQVRALHNCPVTRIDPREHSVVSEGQRYRYRKLVIATGSTPFLPDIPGIDLQRVYTFRDLRDTEALMARRVASHRTVVIGGGLLGVEVARAMVRDSTEVIIVQQAPHLMDRQLDEVAARYLENALLYAGVEVRTGSGVREILPDGVRPGAVGAVRLRDGELIRCDTVVVAAGIRPNIDLARAAGLAVGRGIKVNTVLRTSDPDIHAIGECAEFADRVYGLVAPGLEQASVAAAHIAGDRAVFLGSVSAARLKVAGEHVFSAGVVSEEETSLPVEAVVYEDEMNRLYRRLLVYRGQLVGAIGYGRWDEAARVQSAVTHRRRVFFWELKRFRRSGSLWPVGVQAQVGNWPQSAVVCNCRGVTRGRLSLAMAHGCDTVELLARETGASTVCGSCEPLLRDLLGQSGAASPPPGSAGTAVATIAAVALLVLITQLDPAVSPSVQSVPWWETVWSSGFYKQVSGFSLVALMALGLTVSLKKRVFSAPLRGHFNYWRLWHIAAGGLAIALLMLHSGFEAGDNLNRWLLYNVLALSAVGAVAGTAVCLERRIAPQRGKQLRSWSNWIHLLLAWPLPALLSFHIISVYYF